MTGKRWLGFITADVALDPSISGTAKTVYMVLAIHADKDATCYPSVTTMVNATGYSKSSIMRALAELEDHKVLKRTHRYVDGRQTSNLFTLLDVKATRAKS